MFNLGDVWNLTRESVGQVGNLENATTVVLTITEPDNTTVTPTIVNPPVRTGYYRWDYTPTVAGRHTARWLLTFADGSTDGSSETLDVRPADPGGIVSLEAAKAHLGIKSDQSDAMLRGWIAATTVVIEALVGPCIVRSYTSVIIESDGTGWMLPKSPAIEVTAVARIGTGATVDLANLYLDTAIGKVLFIDGCAPAGRFAVTYTAGRAVIGANIVQAAEIILKNMWETQRGSDMTKGRLSQGGEDDPVMIAAFMDAIPARAISLLRLSDRMFSALA